MADLNVAAVNSAPGAVIAAFCTCEMELVGFGAFVALMVILYADTEARARAVKRSGSVELHRVRFRRHRAARIADAAEERQFVNDDFRVRVMIVERHAALEA